MSIARKLGESVAQFNSAKENPRNRLSRRAVIAGGLAGFAALRYLPACGSIQTLPTTPIVPTPNLTQTITAVDKGYNKDLGATATSTTEQGKQTPFTPEGPFTEKILDTVRRGTYYLGLDFRAKNRTVTHSNFSTGWLANIENVGPLSILTFVTAGHELNSPNTTNLPEEIVGVHLQRPYYDDGELDASFISKAYSTKYDLGVIKVAVVSPSKGPPLQTLAWKDNYIPSVNEKILLDSFPLPFVGNNPGTAKSDAIVVKAQKILPNGVWYGQGLIYHGSSGGPGIIVQNNQPVVVSSIVSFTIAAEGYVYSTPVDVTELIKAA